MIFVTLGSQKFQFNRLLKKIDELIEDGIIKEEVFAQIGYSDYKPQYAHYKEFMDRDEFSIMMDKCGTVITHGGTGTIINAVKKGKKVIAVARQAKYGEHVDGHQTQILRQFDGMGIIAACYQLEDLAEHYLKVQRLEFNRYQSNTMAIIYSVDKFLNTK